MPQNKAKSTETHAFHSDENVLTVNILKKTFSFFPGILDISTSLFP
jgi:hypothetical protein